MQRILEPGYLSGYLPAFVLGMTLAINAAAGDTAAGQQKSLACNACHGSDGISINTLWPNLAGQKTGYLEKQLRDFRSGARQDPITATQVKALSDKDIVDIAAYYSSLSGVPADVPDRH
tara:strand:+ start:146712 stop:147068 length:357 start_codon:yes stop_codon:yes gene_type:complete